MPEPITKYYLFPEFSGREHSNTNSSPNANGAPAPPWDGDRPIKTWVDPNPEKVLNLGIGVGELAIYDAAIEVGPNGTYLAGPDGHPKVSQMAIPLAEAKSPNFLPSKGIVPTESDLYRQYGVSGEMAKKMIANASRKQSVPLKLPPGARVRWAPSLGGTPMVYLPGEPTPEEQGAVGQSRTLSQVYDLLSKVAKKLGVE